MKYALAIVACVYACAQPALDRPMLGQILDHQGLLHPVTGVGGSFQLDPAVGRWILTTACSRQLCLAKTNAAIVSGAASTPAPPGPALIALDGPTAVVYFRDANQFARWQAGALTPLDIQVDAEVLALRSVNSQVSLAVRRASGVWIVAADGTILDSLPAETIAVLLLSDATVYSTATELVLRKSSGAEIRFPVSAVSALFAMDDGYVEALTPGAAYALRSVAGREELYVLPQAPGRARKPSEQQ
jgi:hypothetical protein